MPEPTGISREVEQQSLSAFVQIAMSARQAIGEMESGVKLVFLIIISCSCPETERLLSGWSYWSVHKYGPYIRMNRYIFQNYNSKWIKSNNWRVQVVKPRLANNSGVCPPPRRITL